MPQSPSPPLPPPPIPPLPLARPPKARGARGWWRRNWIGLIALLPLLVLVIAARWETMYWYVWKSQPRLPVTAQQEQWLEFSGAQMRLMEFGAATDVLGSGNKPVALPAGVKVWKAVLEFKAPDQEAIVGCEISLEDNRNRRYGTGPSELSSVRGQSFVTCTKPSENASSEYATTVLFVTPAGVEPVAIQIRWQLQFPRYVRLDIGG